MPIASTAAAAFGPRPLIVSHDTPAARALAGALASLGCPDPQIAASFRLASDLLRSEACHSLFVDLRHSSRHDSPAELLAGLARRSGDRIPAVSVGGAAYGCDWAADAELAIHAQLGLPVAADDLQRLAADPALWRRLESTPRVGDPHTLTGRTLSFSCYSPQMHEQLKHLAQMARHDVTLLVVGETGTGKTTVARLVHELSPRFEQPFMTLACGTLPPELIESELFGHSQGAFTGADRDKQGKFAAAGRGTLLLDEIDVLGLEQQAKLLRVIETGEYEPVGSNRMQRSEARLIAASNRDLGELMASDEFRADLYYRLNVLEFRIPPLRERPLDIVPLTLGFVREFCRSHGVQIDDVHPDFLTCLKAYHWPGNIRELKNHVRRAVLFAQSGELTPDSLALELLKPQASRGAGRNSTLSEQVARTEREILEEALGAHGNNRTATAKALGISRVGLYKKMRRFGMLDPSRSRPRKASASRATTTP